MTRARACFSKGARETAATLEGHALEKVGAIALDSDRVVAAPFVAPNPTPPRVIPAVAPGRLSAATASRRAGFPTTASTSGSGSLRPSRTYTGASRRVATEWQLSSRSMSPAFVGNRFLTLPASLARKFQRCSSFITAGAAREQTRLLRSVCACVTPCTNRPYRRLIASVVHGG